jgi:biopolymer transport protein ExbB/TolQ
MTAALIALGAVTWLVLLLVCLALARAAALGDRLAAERERHGRRAA